MCVALSMGFTLLGDEPPLFPDVERRGEQDEILQAPEDEIAVWIFQVVKCLEVPMFQCMASWW